MFPNHGVAIHYRGDLYNQTISEFLLINKASSLSDLLIGDGRWFEGGAVRSLLSSGCLCDVPWLFSRLGVVRVKKL